MKLNTLAALTAATLILTACGGEKAENAEEAKEAQPVVETTASDASGLDTLDKRISYIIGANMAAQFQRDEIDIDVDVLAMAIEDINAGKEPRLSEEETRQTVTELQARAQAKREAESEALRSTGTAYLAENGKKEGVVTTASGLQYKEITAGDGEKPTAEDTVTVHYKGTLTDGTVFDSSYDRGQPASFPVKGVIPGWVEALQLMNVGDKFELAIPSDLAYGPSGTPPSIGPHATLLFEVELLSIAKAEAAQ